MPGVAALTSLINAVNAVCIWTLLEVRQWPSPSACSDEWPETLRRPTFLFSVSYVCLSRALCLSQKSWHFKSKSLWLRHNDIGIYAESLEERSDLCRPPLSVALCSPVFISSCRHICGRLCDIYHQSFFRSFPLSSEILLISDSTGCLIFQTSRWPFQRTNKVLKMQVLSSCERQLGHSPLLFLLLLSLSPELTPRCLCRRRVQRHSGRRDKLSCLLTFFTCSSFQRQIYVDVPSRFGYLHFNFLGVLWESRTHHFVCFDSFLHLIWTDHLHFRSVPFS